MRVGSNSFDTTAYVDYSSSSISASSGDQITSPDIKTVIQEIVDRAGWSSGNAMMFGIYFQTGAMYANRNRSFRGYEYSSASEAAELVIEI